MPIERPIFVTGLPRTGTTAIHRLLTADPRHQGLELWLAEFPQPRPPRETWSQNPVFQQLDAQFTKAHEENPDYTGLHYMTADEVEECWQLLRQSLHSVSYETLAHVPTYSRWLAQQDWTKPYQRHRAQPAADRAQRPREALGAQESQPPVRARRAVRDVPGRAGGAVPPACRDDHGVDVLTGPAHHRGLVEHVRRAVSSARTRWRPGRVGWNCSTPNAPSTIRHSSTTRLLRADQGPGRRGRGYLPRPSASSSPTRRATAIEASHAGEPEGPPRAQAHLLAEGLRIDRRAGARSASRALTLRAVCDHSSPINPQVIEAGEA